MDFIIIFCGKYLLYIMALALATYWFLSPRAAKVELAAAAVAALALAYGLARVAGLFMQHDQPFAVFGYTPLIPHAIDNSFPSDHSALAGALAGVASLYNKALGILMWVLAVGVAAGRVLSGLHYPVDAVVGLIVGGISAALAYYFVHLYFSARAHTEA
ncbi:MAG TPA: phosphatase PAP2 family protein [Candidatus Paceibacterota bacterium]|jgi:undecaprenyl-diphosphatase|nr:phosphatase PAP2 family protein [Candidatus Paceibacterota bacterium]